ncbi:MAG: tetratricopeptide repeat protein [Phycisphaerae bacterium]|nr:tetratricopeptide repeat protein [Phycisphaerae bacterium]
MTRDRSETMETMRERYLREYRYTHKKSDRIAFFEEIGEMAAAAGASAWKRFADGVSAWMREDMEAALSLFEEALALDPEFAYPWDGKGNVLFDQKRYDEALAAYEKAITLDPESATPWNGKGNVLVSLQRYEEALAAYEKATTLAPENAIPWNGKGNVLLSLQRYDEALLAYEKAITLAPEYAAPWCGKGNVLFDQKRYDEALAAYAKTISLDPESAHPHYGLGMLHWQQGRPRETAEAFRRSVELGLDSPWKEVAESWIERAERMVKSEEAGKSKEECEQADRSSDEALITDLFEAMKDDLPCIRKKKMEFEEQIAKSVGKPRIVGDGAADDMLLVLRDWNSFSPILRRELRGQAGPGPDERRGGGYFLVWKGHGIVIDPGVDFVTQLYRKALSIADVDTVIITHCHLDHTRDVESLVDLNYRYNEARGFKPHPPNKDFRELHFFACYSAFMKYSEYLKTSGCCRNPTQLERGGDAKRITSLIDVQAVPAQHKDINGRDDEAIGLVFVLKDESGPIVRVGITSDSKWIESLPDSFSGCDVVIAHLGTIEVGEERAATPAKAGEAADAGKDVDAGGFLKTDLKNHLGTKGCFRLLQRVKPKIFVIGEFGEELVETRFKILQVFHRLKPKETRFVLGGDSNLAIGLGKELSVCCSHPECARSWTRIPLEEVRPVLGGDFLFQYICSQHGLA